LISITNLKCEPISDYNVIQNTSSNREQNIIEELKKNFPIQFKQQLTELCGKYSDVFGLNRINNNKQFLQAEIEIEGR